MRSIASCLCHAAIISRICELKGFSLWDRYFKRKIRFSAAYASQHPTQSRLQSSRHVGKPDKGDRNFRLFLEKWKPHDIQLFDDNINLFFARRNLFIVAFEQQDRFERAEKTSEHLPPFRYTLESSGTCTSKTAAWTLLRYVIPSITSVYYHFCYVIISAHGLFNTWSVTFCFLHGTPCFT